MKNLLRSSLAIAIGLSMAACHSGSSSDPVPDVVVPTTLDISGTAVKGTLAGALVEVFAADDLSTVLGTDQTDENGDYTITIVDAAGNPIVGAYVVQISADDDTTMVCDSLACGDQTRGDTIAAEDLTGLVLSTFTYSDGTADIEANVNALTSLATDAILASVEANGIIDLSTVTADDVTALQEGASEVVGSLLGVDLSSTNIYDVDIVDASVSADIPTDSTVATTLTLVNAAFSGLTVATDTDLGSVINDYLESFQAIVAILVVEDAVVGDVSSELSTALNDIQSQFNTLIVELVAEVEVDNGTVLEVVEVADEVDLQEVIDTVDAITGGTGGTST